MPEPTVFYGTPEEFDSYIENSELDSMVTLTYPTISPLNSLRTLIAGREEG